MLVSNSLTRLGDLRVGHDRGVVPAAVAGRERDVVGDPHLDVVAHAAQRVLLAVDLAGDVVECEQVAHRADGRSPGGGRGAATHRLLRTVLQRGVDLLPLERDVLEVLGRVERPRVGDARGLRRGGGGGAQCRHRQRRGRERGGQGE